MAEAEATPAPVIYVVFANPKNTKSFSLTVEMDNDTILSGFIIKS